MTRWILTSMMTTTLVLAGCYDDGGFEDELTDDDELFYEDELYDDDYESDEDLAESEDELGQKIGTTLDYECTGGATTTTCTCDPMQGDINHPDTCKGMKDHCHSKGATMECTWITTSNGSCECSYSKASWGGSAVKVAAPVKVQAP